MFDFGGSIHYRRTPDLSIESELPLIAPPHYVKDRSVPIVAFADRLSVRARVPGVTKAEFDAIAWYAVHAGTISKALRSQIMLDAKLI